MSNFISKYLKDGLVSLVSGMGLVGRDKAVTSSYAPLILTDDQLNNAYTSTWLAKKIVTVPANDSISKRRQWQGKQEQIQAIEAEEKRLLLWPKLRKALIWSRLWGGAAILIGDGSLNPEEPLDPARIKALGIQYLTVLSRRHIFPEDIERDITSPNFGRPKMLRVTAANTGTAPLIHPSRVAIFTGDLEADLDLVTSQTFGWGHSVLQAVFDAVRNSDSTAANLASLVFEANVDVFRIPEFWEVLGRKEDENKLLERFRLAALAKGNSRALLLDKSEEYERKQISFASLPEVMQTFLQICAGAADIPATRLLGMSPSGMSATGESDLNNYYDRILSDQENNITPALGILDECLIRSATGARDPAIFYNWTPLKQMSMAERATVGKTMAEITTALTVSVLTPDVMRKSVVNQITELGLFPGLEQDFNAALASGVDFNAELGGGEEEDPNVITADAAPRSLYVSRKVLNVAEITAWAKGEGLDVQDDLHVTVMYSPTPVDWIAVGEATYDQDDKGNMTIAPGGPRLMERFDGGAIVLQFASSRLGWRHWHMKHVGAKPTHDEYQPHVTILYDPIGTLDVGKIEPYRGKILLGPEVFEEVRAI